MGLLKKTCGQILMTLLAAIYALTTAAQETATIKGMVQFNNHPLEFVTITLSSVSDSTAKKQFAVTDSAGIFAFTKIAYQQYQLSYSLIGYQPVVKSLMVNAPMVELEVIYLSELPNQLQAVTITAQKKPIEKTTEGFIVNASANLTQAGGTATDLLKNTPTVSVDAEGQITLRGKTPLILINGRNSTLTNPNNIPASSIESIEIINAASAKYDANAESGIINIKLKKNKQNGTTGAVALGFGKGAKARANSAVLLSHKTKKWNFGIEYDNRFAGRTRNIEGGRTNYAIDENYSINQLRNDDRLEQIQNLTFNTSFSPNEKHSLSFEAIGNREGQDNFENLHTMVYKKNKSFNNSTYRRSDEIERVTAAEFAFDYVRKFTDENRFLTATVSNSLEKNRQNTAIFSQAYTENNTSIGNPFFERTHNYEDEHNTLAKLDYGFPINKQTKFEMGYKGVFRNIIADYETAAKLNNVYIVNTAVSNIFDFRENVQALYAMVQGNLDKKDKPLWIYSIGIRTEFLHNSGHTKNNSTRFTNQYHNFFPNAMLSVQLTDKETLKLSYGKRINRPGLGQLNPFIDITDSLNPHSGNPTLKPEIIDAVELGYSKEWNKLSMSTTIFYRHAANTIRSFYQLQPNGVNLSLPVNIGTGTTWGIENMLNLTLSTVDEINASFSMFQQRLNGSNIAADLVQGAFGWYGKIINNYAAVKNGKLQVIANYNSALATPQGRRAAQYFIDLGYQQKLGKGNSRVGLTIVDVFNTLKSGFLNNTASFTNYRYSKADTRAVMLTFGYTFRTNFKEKLLDNKFSKE